MKWQKNLLFSCFLCFSWLINAQIFVDNTLPYYTDPTKISSIRVGDSFDALTAKLGIQPYDVYHINGEGSTLISYKYRLKLRKVETENNDELHTAASQTTGTVSYHEEKTVFILMVDQKVSSVLTSSGVADSRAILVENNAIRFISQQELVNTDVMNNYITEGLLFYYMNNHIEKADEIVETDAEMVDETQPTADEFKIGTSVVEPIGVEGDDREFYNSLPVGRADFHPMVINSKADITSNLPGKNLNAGKLVLGVIILPSLFFMGREFNRVDLHNFEMQRRNCLYKLQNKNLSQNRRNALWIRVAQCEQVILEKYAKLERKGWSPEKK